MRQWLKAGAFVNRPPLDLANAPTGMPAMRGQAGPVQKNEREMPLSTLAFSYTPGAWASVARRRRIGPEQSRPPRLDGLAPIDPLGRHLGPCSRLGARSQVRPSSAAVVLGATSTFARQLASKQRAIYAKERCANGLPPHRNCAASSKELFLGEPGSVGSLIRVWIWQVLTLEL